MNLSFWTDSPGQTVQTHIRLLLEERPISIYTICHSVCIFWTYYSMVELLCSDFRVITATFSDVQIFRNFMEAKVVPIYCNVPKFRTDRSGQTVQTQIRLLLEEQSDQDLHCLQFRQHLLGALLFRRKSHLVQLLGWLQQIFGCPKF